MDNQSARYVPENMDGIYTLEELIEFRKNYQIKNTSVVLDKQSGSSDILSNILSANKISNKVFKIKNISLSIIDVLHESLYSIINNKASLLKVSVGPLIIFVFYSLMRLGEHYIGEVGELFLLSLFVIFAIVQTCAIFSIHKVILTNDRPKTWFSVYKIKKGILKYSLSSFFQGLLIGITIWISALWIEGVLNNIPLRVPETSINLLMLISFLPSLYLLSRLIISLPPLSINKSGSLFHAWYISRENGWRLMFLYSIVPIIITILSLVVPEDYFLQNILLDFIINLFIYLCIMFEVAIITISYKQLDSFYRNRTKLYGD